jgi:hypothetical protein
MDFMKTRILLLSTSFVVSIILSSNLPANASCNTTTDKWGNTTGYCDGNRVNTRTDKWGNTSGYIGDNRIDTRTDKWGSTSGYAGKNRVSCSTNKWGNTRCN